MLTRMLLNSKLYEVLYVSTIASSAPLSVVAAIAARSRAWNAQHEITGLLIFDGMRFCQQLEGQPQAVLSLLDRIKLDARHSNVTIFHRGGLQARRFRSFAMAFSTLEDADALAKLEVLDGEAAISAFSDLLPALDW